MTLAMNVARKLVRQAIKAKNLNRDDWPASRISEAAKALLESQGENGTILQIARQQVEAERDTAQHQRAEGPFTKGEQRVREQRALIDRLADSPPTTGLRTGAFMARSRQIGNADRGLESHKDGTPKG